MSITLRACSARSRHVGSQRNALERPANRWLCHQVREAFVDGRFTTPKSRSSRRLIELGPRTLELLGKRWQETSFRDESDLVFCHPTKGTPLDASKLARVYLRPALLRAGITKPFRPFHDLRHTALTHEAAAGNPMAYVQLKAGALAERDHRALHPRGTSDVPGSCGSGRRPNVLGRRLNRPLPDSNPLP